MKKKEQVIVIEKKVTVTSLQIMNYFPTLKNTHLDAAAPQTARIAGESQPRG